MKSASLGFDAVCGFKFGRVPERGQVLEHRKDNFLVRKVSVEAQGGEGVDFLVWRLSWIREMGFMIKGRGF